MPKGCFPAPVTSAKWLFNPLLGQRRRKKNRQKSRYFKLSPNLAHRKLANYAPSSSPLRVLSFTQRFFKNVEKIAVRSEKYLGCCA